MNRIPERDKKGRLNWLQRDGSRRSPLSKPSPNKLAGTDYGEKDRDDSVRS